MQKATQSNENNTPQLISESRIDPLQISMGAKHSQESVMTVGSMNDDFLALMHSLDFIPDDKSTTLNEDHTETKDEQPAQIVIQDPTRLHNMVQDFSQNDWSELDNCSVDWDLILPTKPAPKTRKRKRMDFRLAPSEREYFKVTDADVLLGRGGAINVHKGNVRFHEYKRELQPMYFAAEKKQDRTPIAQALADRIQDQGGKFLEKDEKGWYKVHKHRARDKCSQALREDLSKEERRAKRRKYQKKKKGTTANPAWQEL